MCGIAGISAAPPADLPELEAALARMRGRLRHRGPDAEGQRTLQRPSGGGATLIANTRLAILDVSPAGAQPMHDPENGNWIVLNGEIYNHLDVRDQLGPDVEWRSGSDTETILRAFGAWGVACLDRLRGMFAIAVWEAKSGRLWIARDRIGIKPLYFWTDGRALVFASEIRAILASRIAKERLDATGLASYVRFGSVAEPHTLIERVRSLPAGHWMRVRNGKIEETRAYWRALPEPVDVDPKAATKEIRGHLARAIEEHLLSDVPVGCFLSGGIDSSAVAAWAARAAVDPIRTFTVGFGEAALDESRHAAKVAERIRSEHESILLSDEEVAALAPRAVEAMDLPSADGVNTYVVSRAVAQAGLKVVLSGLGGDELFGGYRSFSLLPKAERWANLLGLVPASLRAAALGGGDSGRRASEMTARHLTLARRYEALRSFWPAERLRAMGLDFSVGYGLEEVGEALPAETRVSLLELGGYMKSTLLRDSDSMSMAHSIELRVPFLDHSLVESCLRLGTARLSPDGRPKAALLDAAGDLLPREIWDRPKQGFVLPMERWMRGPLKGFVDGGLDQLKESNALPGVDLDSLRSDFARRRLQWARLWQFSTLGHWLAANHYKA